MPDETPEERLREAERELERSRNVMERKKASVETLQRARDRLRVFIERLSKDEDSDAQKRVIAALRRDVKDFGDRIEEARQQAAKEEARVNRLTALIARLRERLSGGKIVMFDSVDVPEIPANAEAVAGYTSGLFPTFPVIQQQFPNAKRLSIAVTSSNDAECLDVEPGDAEPRDAPAWVRRQKERGVRKPVIYASLSTMPTILSVLAQNGISRGDVRLWTAHYTHHAHVCSPACGFGFQTTADATQWTNKAMERNLDQSLCSGSFFTP